MNNTIDILSAKIDLVKASNVSSDIFGFSDFVTALALLIIVYTTTNNRYKYRLSIVPFPLKNLSFIALVFIGIIIDIKLDRQKRFLKNFNMEFSDQDINMLDFG